MHRTIAAFALAVFSVAAIATSSAAADTDVYVDFLQKSGLWEQAERIGPAVQTGIDSAAAKQGRLDARKQAMFRDAAAEAYAADRLREGLRARLSDTLAADDARGALAWYETPLGTRIAGVEASSRAAHAAAEAALQAEAAAKAFASLPAERRSLIQRVIKATDASELVANIAINGILGVVRGVAALSGRSQTDVEAEIGPRVALLRAQLKGAIKPSLVAASAVVYATLTDADIEQYLVYLESDAGRRLSSVVNRALDSVLTAAAVDLGERIAREAAADEVKRNQT